MSIDSVYSDLTLKNGAKMALLVMDGLGDIATAATDYKTPLEAANTPNLDALAKESAQGRLIPAAHGITPGSGPGHLGLFGYDPLEYEVGRGVIEALGLGLELNPGDVAARANFCTLDADGLVTDRRAGRIETELCEERCAKLSEHIKQIGDAEVVITPGKGHRFVVIFRGADLAGPLSDTDPHREGLPIAETQPDDPIGLLFKTRIMNHSVILKRFEPALATARQPVVVTTVVYFPYDIHNRYDGGESLDFNAYSFHSDLSFKITKDETTTEIQEQIHEDMEVLKLINSMHSLDPFMFKSKAEQQEADGNIHDAYFAISPQEWDKIRLPIRDKIQKLVSKALGAMPEGDDNLAREQYVERFLV